MIDLSEIIKTMKNKMDSFRPYYEANESAVRDQIINPILKALGWNTDDPEDVRTELSCYEGFSDYCLFKDKKKIFCVEAKNLSINVENRKEIQQLAKYCFNDGMEYGIITNGAVWILFKSFQQGIEMEKRKIWKIDIEKDDITEINRKFNTISKENITEIDELTNEIQILDEIWCYLLDTPKDLKNEFINIFHKKTKERYPKHTLNQSGVEYFIEEVVMKHFNKEKEINSTSQPEETVIDSIQPLKSEEKQKIKIGNDAYNFEFSKEILILTANWLIKEGKLTKEDCPVISGKKRFLIHTEPKHNNGKNFIYPKKLSNGLYIETNYSASDCKKRAYKLLERFGYPETMLEILD